MRDLPSPPLGELHAPWRDPGRRLQALDPTRVVLLGSVRYFESRIKLRLQILRNEDEPTMSSKNSKLIQYRTGSFGSPVVSETQRPRHGFANRRAAAPCSRQRRSVA